MIRCESWLVGYPDKFSVAGGEPIVFHVSGAGESSFDAHLVKLIHGDTSADGPGFKETELVSSVNGSYALHSQPSHFGSYGRLADVAKVPDGSFSFFCFLQPTLSKRSDQTIVSMWDGATGEGIAVLLEPGLSIKVKIGVQGETVEGASEGQLLEGVWYALSVSFDRDGGRVTTFATPHVNAYNSRFGRLQAVGPVTLAVKVRDVPRPQVGLLIGAQDRSDGGVVRGDFNGKIALPCIFGNAMDKADHDAAAKSGAVPALTSHLVAWWDLSRGTATARITGGQESITDGWLVNLPTRAVTAHNWDGSSYSYLQRPDLYGAVHLHDDDVEDVGWEGSCGLSVPEELPSGMYALRLRAGKLEDHIPFVVRPQKGREKRVAFLVPSASYQAYANEHVGSGSAVGQAVSGHTPAMQPLDILKLEHPEFGRSMYDLHNDGSGVAYSSRRRPILNMRPRHRFSYLGTWQLPADLYIIDWLEAMGYAYDCVTDEDLHREGVSLLAPYSAVMTGSHPEYMSHQMLNALDQYVLDAGHLMYMGGNGLYWAISYDPDRTHIMEVRRGEGGSRAWQASPGEMLHSTTGEKGGTWRNRGRAPQKLVGVGFAAQGFNGSSYYHRMPGSYAAELSWIFEGLAEDETIGDFGLVGAGAAGQEVDRVSVDLGTPLNTQLLAVSQGHDDSYLLVVEDLMFTYRGLGGTEHRDVRADLTYFEHESGGAVFSTGSIAWSGSLSHNNYSNNVSRLTKNVLDRFQNS